jgi:UDP-N-acetylmuramate--alanine ligase
MKMHFIGCKGVSMQQLMSILEYQGIMVSGSDLTLHGHNKKNVSGADAVVYTSAISADNVELLEANQKKIPIIERSKLLGQISQSYNKVVAVAGAHGKTTTTTMIGSILHGRNPTIHVGGDAIGSGGGKIGSKNYFVTEACEYKRNFLYLQPNIGVLLNFALDHTDYYNDEEDLWDAYNGFADKSQHLVLAHNLKDKINKDVHVTTFGNHGDFNAKNIIFDSESLIFDCFIKEQLFGRFVVKAHGMHNIDNALASIAVCKTLGLEYAEIMHGLKKFAGVKRRFEIVYHGKFGTIVSDYAHHPDEIVASINTARQISKNVRVVFEPHTYSRTASLQSKFVKALQLADSVALLPIYAAREQRIKGVSSKQLSKLIPAQYLDSDDAVYKFIKNGLSDSVTIIMGAGTIDKYARVNFDTH